MKTGRWHYKSIPERIIDLRQQLAASEQARQHIVIERAAQLTAHRACCGTEHDPLNGKIHGYCVICGVPWPCDYAGIPPTKTEEEEDKS